MNWRRRDRRTRPTHSGPSREDSARAPEGPDAPPESLPGGLEDGEDTDPGARRDDPATPPGSRTPAPEGEATDAMPGPDQGGAERVEDVSGGQSQAPEDLPDEAPGAVGSTWNVPGEGSGARPMAATVAPGDPPSEPVTDAAADPPVEPAAQDAAPTTPATREDGVQGTEPGPEGGTGSPAAPPASEPSGDDLDRRPLPSPDLGPIETPGPAPAPAHEAVVLAVTNQKGGVGKTTTTVSLGAALAADGLDVLLVDLDPQGNATTGLGLRVSQGAPSSYRVIVEQYPLVDAAEPTAVRRLHIVPSSLDLAGAEIELVPQYSRERRLREALDTVRDQYDVVLVDCPPSLGLLTVNALVAADQVLVPIQCEYYALEGLGQLMRTVEMVRTGLNDGLTLGGVLMTMYDARTNLSQQVVDEVREHFGDLAFGTVIPRTVRLSEAPSYGQPITEFDPSSRGARSYQRLARELARRLGLAPDTGSGSPLDALLGTAPADDVPTADDATPLTSDDVREASVQPEGTASTSSPLSGGEDPGTGDPGTSPQDDPPAGSAATGAVFHVDPPTNAAPAEEGPTWPR